ncbi:NADPH dehydrogenase NamA [Paenibacillus sp. D2_2]|uniref:NADPH dehydrogenase NamA n=1 Tax=Paenibacillus sp. D2_2 TaxID=3073092 RepID=UPI002815298F|nr:NADPH dehydrogenase NamA [Paenibacillus sp. D2_2]WMT38921.1 NADPH dehydrogenase NamA [Paenibacillus sp. D2_2]
MNRKLFSPFTIKNTTFKNRVVMSPMCMYSSPNQDGKVADWHLVHYPTRAVGGVGLIIIEATAVSPEGRITYRDLGIWDDEHIEGLQRLVSLIQQNGAKAGIQLAHAGRKADLEETIFAPSAIPFTTMKTPKAADLEEIRGIVQNFRNAARRAREAGFDVIEIHAAHGYLLNEFLSPLANHREDEYGGNADNRYRLLGEVIEAVKQEWNGPLFVRVSAEEYAEGGNHLEDYIYYARKMKEQGVDLIDCSSGAVVPAHIDIFPGYQVNLSEQIRHQAEISTGTVGLITNPHHAEEIIGNNRADLVLLGRELLRDPYWTLHAAKELGAEIQPPKPYDRRFKDGPYE